jgi:hypothetical protein
MKNKANFVAAVLSAVALIAAPAAESKLVQDTISGTLSDSMCKGSHTAMIKMGGYGKTAVSCTQKCLKEGNSLVLIDKKTKAVYSLQNPGPAKKYAGKNVVITGHIDSASKVVHIHSVKPG